MSTTAPEILQTLTVEQANALNTKAIEMKAEAATLTKQAEAFTIEDSSDFEFSLTIAEEAIRRQKAIAEFFAPTKKLAHQLHKSITEMENAMLAPYQVIERLIKDRRANWRQEQERIRRKKEDEEREALLKKQQEEALAQAAQLEKEGEKEAAQVVVEQALAAPPPVIVMPSTVPKQSGSSVRKRWNYRIDDESKIQREFCSSDPKKLRAHVEAYGLQSTIAGITVFEEEIESIRTKGK